MESDKPHLDLLVFVANMVLGGSDVFQRQTRSPLSMEFLASLSKVFLSVSRMPVIYVVLAGVTILYAYGPFIGLGFQHGA